MHWLGKTAFIVAAYLLGSIPSGYWIGRGVAGMDIRTVGSGNIGATNVARNLGPKWGLLVLLLDVAKGALPVALALHIWPSTIWENTLCVSLVALASFVGHLAPVFLRFRGGKGVATALGITLVLVPLAALLAATLFLLVAYRSRYVSLGSISAALSLPVLAAIARYNPIFVGLSAIFSLFIIVRHRENIRALFRGTERKL